jgi:hypothetical protein
VQLAEDEGFNKVIENRDDIMVTEYEIAGLNSKAYFFRISSIAKDDYQGEWSDVLSFTIVSDNALPSKAKER